MKNKIKYKKNRQQGVFSFSLKTFKTPRLEKYKLNKNKIKLIMKKFDSKGFSKSSKTFQNTKATKIRKNTN